MHHLMHRPQVNKVYKSVGVGVLTDALATITLTFIQQANFNFELYFFNFCSNTTRNTAESIGQDLAGLIELDSYGFVVFSRGNILEWSEIPTGNHAFGISCSHNTDANGNKFIGYGMYAALSYDDGKTWPVKRLLVDGKERHLNGGAWTGDFDMDATHAEPRGYLAGTQSPDNMIHIVSSRIHYRFNLAWLEEN